MLFHKRLFALPQRACLLNAAAAVVASVVLLVCGRISAATLPGSGSRLCGPLCLVTVCQKLGIDLNADEAARLCHYDETTGTSMLGLANAARAKGLCTAAMKISLRDLSEFKGLAIAYLQDRHFIVITGAGSGRVVVTDPPRGPEDHMVSDLQPRYSGFALLIGKDEAAFPEPKDEGPDLRLDSYDWDFGAVNRDAVPTYSFRCRNLGSADVVISKVEPSCPDCLTVVDWTRTIPSGGTGEINGVVNAVAQQGSVSKQLYVTSNDPISPMIQLIITGYVRPAVMLFSPRALSFGAVRRTESAVREVRVPVARADGFTVTSVLSDSPFVEGVVAHSKLTERPGYVITASLKPGASVGELKAKLTIVSDHPKQPKAEIPVTATITGNIDLDRDSFFLGMVKKGKKAVANVTISTVAKDPLKLGKIDNSLDYLTIEAKPKVEGREYMLTATLKRDAPLGNIKGDITVHTSDPDQPVIKIPVYAYVEK